MLMIGAAGRNVGKTDLVCDIIAAFADSAQIVGVKVTTIDEKRGKCPRGGAGCGVCSSLDGDFCITEETDGPADKDTVRMLAAGAQRVFWLRVLKAHLHKACQALQQKIGAGVVSVCESNSLRLVARPDLFLMVQDQSSECYKPSAAGVRELADRVVLHNHGNVDLVVSDIYLEKHRWMLHEIRT